MSQFKSTISLLILVTLFLAIFIPLVNCSFRLPIDHKKCSFSTIYIVKSPLKPMSKINQFLNQLISTENEYNNKKLSWVLTDIVPLMGQLVDRQLLKRLQKTPTYILPKVTNFVKETSCVIILTGLHQIFMERRWFVHENLYSSWEAWLKLAAAGKRLPLSGTTNAILSFTLRKDWKSPISVNHDSSKLAPAQIFVVILDGKDFNLLKVEWTCLQCQVENMKLQSSNPFTTDFHKLLLKKFRNVDPPREFLSSHPFPENPGVSWDDLLTKPIINIENNEYLFKDQMAYCNLEKHTFSGLPQSLWHCTQTAAHLSVAMAKHLNYSAVFGRSAENPWPNVYFTGLLIWTTINEGHVNIWHLEGQQLLFTDMVLSHVQYCDKKWASIIPDPFEILGKPFDNFTWVGLFASALLFAAYSILESPYSCGQKGKRTFSHVLCDTYAIIIQNWTEKPVKISMLFLNICFILKFLYTCTHTYA